MKPIKQLSTLFVLLFFTISFAWAAPLAGHVILSKGSVSAISEDGTTRVLKRRSEIFNGDTIKTGAVGSVQIRFVDKALMTIKANSEMNIESYLLRRQDDANKNEKVLMSLVKGGFRTITGTIGKGDKSAYEVKTPAASIGIRGTNYEVQQEADGGFVMGVYSGGIRVENAAGSLELGSGADFNFTRVKPNTPPKGLLAPPVTLAENTATEQNDEADEANDEETEGEQVASEENNEDGEQAAEDEAGDGSDDNSDKEGKTIIAQISDDSNSNVDGSAGDDSNSPEVDPQAVLDVLASLDVDLDDSIRDALDTALTDAIEDNKDEFIEEQGLDPSGNTTFDFTNPYANVNVDASGNPFATTVISDEAYALSESGQLAFIALPINSTNNYSGDSPSISTELLLTSEVAADLSTNTDYDYTTDPTSLYLYYTVIDPSTGEKTEYDINMDIAFDSTGMDGAAFAENLTNIANSGIAYVHNDTTGQSTTVTNPGVISFTFNGTTGQFEIQQDASTSLFLTELELSFNNDGSAASDNLMLQLGATIENENYWYADAGLDLFIGNGAWDDTSNKPILVNKDTHSYEDPSGNVYTEDRIEVVSKPLEADATVSSLAGFGACIDSEQTCDIQVDSVVAADNIRWGAWLAEPGEGIQITELDIGDGGSIRTDQEEQILAFWLAAERADINQLTGSANFTAQSDCARFNQCIGFSDDGIVQTLTANFDVNFDTGAITNGNLYLETTQDPDLGLLGGTGAVESTWTVNFSGQMSTDSNNNRMPEFQTTSLNGSVTDNTTPANSSTSVIGNIGGIFVKPGDVFAGGYNLGTTDTNKHAAGVFSMEKTP